MRLGRAWLHVGSVAGFAGAVVLTWAVWSGSISSAVSFSCLLPRKMSRFPTILVEERQNSGWEEWGVYLLQVRVRRSIYTQRTKIRFTRFANVRNVRTKSLLVFERGRTIMVIEVFDVAMSS